MQEGLMEKGILSMTVQENPMKHIKLLEQCLLVVQHLIGISQELTRATIFHTDLHGAIVFVRQSHNISY